MSLFADLLLPLYADGPLPRPLRRWVRGRLRTDEALRVSYEGLRRRDRTTDRALSPSQMRVVLRGILDNVATAPHRRPASSSTALLVRTLLALAVTATLLLSRRFEGRCP